MTSYPAPSVHLGGSGPANLREQFRAVYDASQALLEALAQARPHPRDYYVQPDGMGRWSEALEAHRDIERQVLAIQEWAVERLALVGP